MSTEAWSWGDLFELDVPLTADVRDLGEMVEIRFADAEEAPLFLAAFSPLDAGPEAAVRDALERFAATRGHTRAAPLLSIDPHGVVAGRLAFITDLAWEALAVAWNQHLVVAFSAASTPEAPIFECAETLLASLRPLELRVPAPPVREAAGDF